MNLAPAQYRIVQGRQSPPNDIPLEYLFGISRLLWTSNFFLNIQSALPVATIANFMAVRPPDTLLRILAGSPFSVTGRL